MSKFPVDEGESGVHGLNPFPCSFSVVSQSWSAQIAQLAEHVLGKDEVAGSNPVLGSRANKIRRHRLLRR